MGWIEDRGEGRSKRWRVRYRDPQGRPIGRSFEFLEDAKAFKARTETQLYDGTWLDPEGPRTVFADWAEHSYSSWRSLRDTTLRRHRSNLDLNILPEFGDRRIGTLDPVTLQEWVRSLEDDYVPTSVHKIARTMSKILAGAVKADLIRSNPMIGIELPSLADHSPTATFLEPFQVERVADTIGPPWRAFVWVGALAGLRPGELFGLQVVDLSMLRRTLTVQRNVVTCDGHVRIHEPKTRRGRRSVPMAGRVVDELAAHLNRRQLSGPGDWVFGQPGTDKPVHPDTFRHRIWNPAREAAGLDTLRVHDLRHTAATTWIANDATPVEVAAWLGHSSTTTVMDLYGHFFPTHGDRVMANLDAMYAAGR